MIVEDHTKRPTYDDIDYGDCFEYDRSIYIKTKRNNGTNAVDLIHGVCDDIPEHSVVTKVKAKLVIEAYLQND